AFHDIDSDFFYKDLYIFLIDMEGNVLAHGGDVSLAGTNQLNLRDSVGRYFIREFIDLMRNSSQGWLEYKWRNYQTHEIETKMSYLQKVNEQLFIGCGIYYGN
ncbi:MAG: cache domain-containing protein, partial [Candidatus Cloacimonetes bacterium]|nr:cache domain-containing protein [Candidatus Cloacimonadota bacterium]